MNYNKLTILLIVVCVLDFTSVICQVKSSNEHYPFLDIYGGVGNTELSIHSKVGFEEYLKENQLGYFLGVAVGWKSISAGLFYNVKSFDIKPPVILVQYGIDTSMQKVKLSYISIPITYDLLKIVFQNYFTLYLSLGPMVSFLISKEENVGLGIKDFDFSFNGKLWGMLPLDKKVSLTAGVNLVYNGINNMGNTEYVSKVTSSQFAFFGGIRITLP
jgi:hypothetical protein